MDGTLVALAVLDIMPEGVSSVYLIYLKEYERFGLGKLSVLMEIALTRQLGFPFYYMGFYIPSCQKMRYKGEYKGQQVLDMQNGEWNNLEDVSKQLDKKHVPLSVDSPLHKSVFEVGMESILTPKEIDDSGLFEELLIVLDGSATARKKRTVRVKVSEYP